MAHSCNPSVGEAELILLASYSLAKPGSSSFNEIVPQKIRGEVVEEDN